MFFCPNVELIVRKTFTITKLIEKLFIPAKIDESIKLLFPINKTRDECTIQFIYSSSDMKNSNSNEC